MLVVIGLLSVATLNYTIDPAYLYSGDEYAMGIANYLLSGYNVTNITKSNYNDRLMKKVFISGISQSKEVIVLGSSRSLQLRSTIFPGKSFFNNGVAGATFEDYLALYELYISQNKIPSIVVLGLDPWVLNKNNGQLRWIFLKEEYLAMAKSLSLSVTTGKSLENSFLPKIKELFSLPYTKESIDEIFTRRREYYPAEESDFKSLTMLSDGTYFYSAAFRASSVEQVEETAIEYAKTKPVYSLGDFTELDNTLINSLVTFIEYLKKNDITVIFFLPPYHPTTYKILSESPEYSIIVDAEKCFRDIASTRGIQVAGGYNPEDSSSQKEDFYDGMHPKETSIMKCFEKIQRP